jgi:hypothetical protein
MGYRHCCFLLAICAGCDGELLRPVAQVPAPAPVPDTSQAPPLEADALPAASTPPTQAPSAAPPAAPPGVVGCAPIVSPLSVQAPAPASVRSISASGCGAVPTTSATWLSLATTSAGFDVYLAANSGAARNAAIDVGGTIVTVTQASGVPTMPGWSPLGGAGLPTGSAPSSLVVAKDGAIYVAYPTIGVFRSIDGGARFDRLSPPYTTNDLPPLDTQTIETLGVNDLDEVLVGITQNKTNGDPTAPFIYRWNKAQRAWITAPPFPLASNLQLQFGYLVMQFAQDSQGRSLAVWPFVGAVFQSSDHGNTFTKLADMSASSDPGNSNGAGYSIARNPTSNELFFGGERSGIWRSTDDGTSWSAVDPDASTELGIAQNDMGVGFSATQDAVFSVTGLLGGKFLTRYASDGTISPYMQGFASWELNGGSSARRVIRRLPLTRSGYLFFAYGNDQLPTPVPFDVYRTDDHGTWAKITHPAWLPANNCIDSDGDGVVVAAQDGSVWRYVPPFTAALPTLQPIARQSAAVGTPLALHALASDPSGAAVGYDWRARGPAPVSFSVKTAADTSATFSASGDYVVTVLANNGARSAGTSFVVRVGP